MKRLLLVPLVLIACDGGTKPPAIDAGSGTVDSSPDAAITPVFRNPVTLPDNELAMQALQILGADVPDAQPTECNACHGLTRASIRAWSDLSTTAMTDCFTDLAVTTPESARAMLDCMRTNPAMPTSDFATSKMGVYASAARLPWFAYTFKVAYGDQSAAALVDFEESAGMPKSPVVPLTQGQFDIVAEWFARNLPQLDQTLAPEGQGTTCAAGISPEVAAHIADKATTGWRAVNRMNLMAMYGCGAATDPRDCLQDDAQWPVGSTMPYGAGWDVTGAGHARLLRDVTFRSYYWTRSSADGRFIATGDEASGSKIIDLERSLELTASNTQYDPSFFPDNGGFVFQGGTQGARNNVCAMSVLTSEPASVTMAEAGCSRANMIGLYQHVGRALGGGDFFAIDGEFTNDNGGRGLTHDPDASFDNMGRVDFTPLIFDGTKFAQKQLTRLQIPYEGDVVLSPSSELIMSRVAGQNDRQLGYVLRKITKTWNGSTYDLTPSKIGRYCIAGAKVNFSFDERFVVYHHYVTNTTADAIELGYTGTNDPGFTPYISAGAANIYVLDLGTGVTKRITKMNPGQYALFPHFRSDGWIYADVRDNNTDHEYFIAHDGALLLE